MAVSNDLGISQPGMISFDGTNQFFGRTLTAGTGISIADGDGISANPVISNTGALNDYHCAKLIVSSDAGSGGNYTTITSALADASNGDTIFVQPGATGIYAEDIVISKSVNIVGFGGDSLNPNVTIRGSVTTAINDSVTLSNLRIEGTGSGFSIRQHILGGYLLIVNCFVTNLDNAGILVEGLSSGSGTLEFINCNFDSSHSGNLLLSGDGIIFFRYCSLKNSSAASTLSAFDGQLYMVYSTSGWRFEPTLQMRAEYCQLDTSALNLSCIQATGTLYLRYCRVTCGTNYCIGTTTGTSVTVVLENNLFITSNAEVLNILAGACAVTYGNNIFESTGKAIDVAATQTTLVCQNSALYVTAPGAYPYTVITQDAVIIVDTSSARTINLPASPVSGQKHIIKDNVGSANTNNITVSGNGKNIDGAASQTINISYGSLSVVYNGTQYIIV